MRLRSNGLWMVFCSPGIIWSHEKVMFEEMEGAAGKTRSGRVTSRESSGEESHLNANSDFLVFFHLFPFLFPFFLMNSQVHSITITK